jgi:hypothetical protein
MCDGSNSVQRCEEVSGTESAEPPPSSRCNFGEVEFL